MKSTNEIITVVPFLKPKDKNIIVQMVQKQKLARETRKVV